MKKICLLFFVLILFNGFTSAKTYTLDKTQTQINVKKGDKLVILLRENPSTGYLWKFEIKALTEPVILQEKLNRYISDKSKKHIIGAPGQRKYVLKVKANGSAQILGTYSRPWEKQKQEPNYVLNIFATK